MVLEVMRLGEPVLMKEALPVRISGAPDSEKLVADMVRTPCMPRGSVGIAAPSGGREERIICFGFEASSRYPDAPAVPWTVLINPTVELLLEGTADDWEDGWEGASPSPACAGLCLVPGEFTTPALDLTARPSSEKLKGFMPEWCSMSLTT